jgi:S-phase kinase-associated protein 1
MIKLETSDGKQYTVEEKVICQSNLIKNILQDLEITDAAIPLPNITSSIMDIVLEYAKLHQDDETTPEDREESEEDLKLVQVPHQVLFDIVLAANYLDFPGLLHLGTLR